MDPDGGARLRPSPGRARGAFIRSLFIGAMCQLWTSSSSPRPGFSGKFEEEATVHLLAASYEYQFNGPPEIEVPPTDQKGIPGNNITFSVVGPGASPLAYQWQFNGTDIANATDSALQLNAVLKS